MSMLAERKQKTSWILDPRQNDWSKDSNKFGQKMLEKMGWTPGKGLGASEQGMTEALRVKYKSDMKGLGCKDPKYEWLKQQQEFDNFLSTFHAPESEEDQQKRISLEEKSKQTKTRVFYHKSIKGKDITRYSEKDLQCIIGFKNQTENEETAEESESSSIVNSKKNNIESTEVTFESDNLKNKKNKNKKKKEENVENNDLHNNGYVGSNDLENETEERSTEVTLESENSKKKKNKKKKKKEEDLENKDLHNINSNEPENKITENSTEDASESTLTKKKKKNKKKKKEEAQETCEFSQEIESNSCDVKIKKKKRETNEIQDFSEAQKVLNEDDDLAVPKKKRRKNKD